MSFTNCIDAQRTKAVPAIIFDTDMGPDYDDLGAIAVLYALEARKECKVLATLSSNGRPAIAPTIELLNRYFNRGEVPVGIAGPTAPAFTHKSGWNEALIQRFAPELRSKQYPYAVEIYRRILSQQPDRSVTIVTVGFLSNINDLLHSELDTYSKLSGVDLVKKKVKQWVAMAADFPQGREFNVYKDTTAAYQALALWPQDVPIVFSGFDIGPRIRTGKRLAEQFPQTPIGMGYAINFSAVPEKGNGRQSWDQTAVLCAVRTPEKYFYVIGPSKIEVSKDGSNIWNPNANANHFFLVHKYPYAQIENLLEELMMYQPSAKL